MPTNAMVPANAGQLANRGALTLDSIAEMTGHTPAEVVLIAGTVDKSTPLEELLLYIARADAMKLNPLLRQCYLIPRAGKFVLQTGIDGYRLQAARSRCYAGSDDPVYRGTVKITTGAGDILAPESCSVTVWRSEGGRKNAFSATVFWNEYYPGPGPIGDVWRSRPRGQLAKCAEALALRKGFPAELAGLEPMLGEVDDEAPTDDPLPQPTRTVQENAALHARIFDNPELRRLYGSLLAEASLAGVFAPEDHSWDLDADASEDDIIEQGRLLRAAVDRANKARKPPAEVRTGSPLAEELAGLIEDAARLEVPFDDCKVGLPAPPHQVARAIATLEQRVGAKKAELAGDVPPSAPVSQDALV